VVPVAAPVVVYVFDGGVLTTHPELEGRVRVGFNFYNEPKPCNAHGTAVAGAIAGKTLGAAPTVEIVDVNILDCKMQRSDIRAIVAATAWVVEDLHGRRAVANWSFLVDSARHFAGIDSAVALLNRNGVPVIVSSGNFDGDACAGSPANAPGVLVVGAATRTGHAPSTAYGPCVDAYALGQDVTLPSYEGGHANTQQWNGTSMAAGFVSGFVARYLQAYPEATLPEIRAHVRIARWPVR
jgi:subtilisin family serine protease